MTDTASYERIAKRMAASGACSRRTAEKIILEGRVHVNGVLVNTPATLVTASDTITIDGEVLHALNKTRLWLYHKPVGLLTTHRDPEGRPTVFEHLPKHMPRVVSVGRLDVNSEGLLLLTTSGELARQFEHPKHGHARSYRVRVNGIITPEMIQNFATGITIDGVSYQGVDVEFERRAAGRNQWYRFTLHEGKNREIRKLCQHVGLHVSRLIRTDYGPFSLGDLKAGDVREVKNLKAHLP